METGGETEWKMMERLDNKHPNTANQEGVACVLQQGRVTILYNW